MTDIIRVDVTRAQLIPPIPPKTIVKKSHFTMPPSSKKKIYITSTIHNKIISVEQIFLIGLFFANNIVFKSNNIVTNKTVSNGKLIKQVYNNFGTKVIPVYIPITNIIIIKIP